jgi:hypothetical protein
VSAPTERSTNGREKRLAGMELRDIKPSVDYFDEEKKCNILIKV